MTSGNKKIFEDYIEVIETAIRKQRSRWRLDCIPWFDFQDVEQVIKLHIYKKWDMWNQDLPLEPWINTIITNQIRNLVRNHYGNYVKPCVNCTHNLGEDGCSFTASKIQDTECMDFRKWSRTKKAAFEIKISVSSENHAYEMGQESSADLSFDDSIEKLNKSMKKELSEAHYTAYKMLFFEDSTEEDVANFMGYKTNEKKRKAGYRQVKNLKNLFVKKATEILKDQDIIFK
jgi:hypothetical protein